MKKIILIIALVCLYSCNKDWFDYTNKYVGNFKFTCIVNSYGAAGSSQTTFVYDGNITRLKRGRIRIKYGAANNYSIDTDVDKNGNFSAETANGGFKDKNNLTFFYTDGLAGGGETYNVSGVRQ